MKKLIRAARDIYEGEAGYLGKKHPATVEVLGEVAGHMKVFQVFVDGVDEGYWCGSVPEPSGNFAFWGEWAIDVKKAFGFDFSNASDSEILKTVNQRLMEIVNDPRSQALFDYLNIDPLDYEWEYYLSRYLEIPGVGRTNAWQGFTHFIPLESVVRKMLESGSQIDPDIDIPKGMIKDIKQYDRRKAREMKLASQEYPLNADDDVVEGIHDLKKFIIDQTLGYSDTLEDAESFVRSKTVDYRRSSRYKDPEAEKHIQDVFDWAETNNLSVHDLISYARKIYKLWLAKH